MNFLPEKNMGYLHIILWKKMFCAKKVMKLPDLTVFIYSNDRSAYSAAGKIFGMILGIYIVNHSQTHECGNWD
jgi:hypothetical protein